MIRLNETINHSTIGRADPFSPGGMFGLLNSNEAAGITGATTVADAQQVYGSIGVVERDDIYRAFGGVGTTDITAESPVNDEPTFVYRRPCRCRPVLIAGAE